MTWSAKRAGFESGGCGERSFNRKPRQAARGILNEFAAWRGAVLQSLTRDNIPWQVLQNNTIMAVFPGGEVKRLTLQEQKEDFLKWKQKRKPEAQTQEELI